jgi:putative ABC transport system permease protein
MLVAGAEPLDAVRLQLILLYLVLGAVATSSLLALVLVRRRLIQPGARIRELAGRPWTPSVR